MRDKCKPARAHTHTLTLMHTELKAVPHAGLGYHFLRVQVKPNGGWGSSNGSEAQSASAKSTSSRRRDDGGPCVTARKMRVTACKHHNQAGTSRRRPFRISATIAALFVGQSAAMWDCPPAVTEKEKKTVRLEPRESRLQRPESCCS